MANQTQRHFEILSRYTSGKQSSFTFTRYRMSALGVPYSHFLLIWSTLCLEIMFMYYVIGWIMLADNVYSSVGSDICPTAWTGDEGFVPAWLSVGNKSTLGKVRGKFWLLVNVNKINISCLWLQVKLTFCSIKVCFCKTTDKIKLNVFLCCKFTLVWVWFDSLSCVTMFWFWLHMFWWGLDTKTFWLGLEKHHVLA